MRRFRLPIISGILLMLSFYPFYFWPLALVAFIPLFYFSLTRHGREVLWGAMVAAGIGFFPTLYFTLAQLVFQPQGVLFTYATRASSIVFLLGMGAALGGMLLLYRTLRTRSALYNALLAAALYILFEAVWYTVFGGYYYASLSHALVHMPPARWYAGVGGAALVSYIAAAIQMMCAETLYKWRQSKRAALIEAGAFCALLVVGTCAALGARPPMPAGAGMPVALIQPAPAVLGDLSFGSMQDGTFTDPSLEASIKSASAHARLVIYTFSPVAGLTYRGTAPSSTQETVPDAALGEWLSGFVPASTTVMLWNTLADNGGLYDEDTFWQAGKESEYRKQDLYRFSDYSPAWAYMFGLQRSSSTIVPGDAEALPHVSGQPVGALICSEIQQPALARRTAATVPYIIAIGFDSMFPGDLAGTWSLAGARYRAAENNVAVVHGTLMGPSAIINPDGSVQRFLPFGTSGVLTGTVPTAMHEATIYSRFGDTPLYCVVFVLLVIAAGIALASSLGKLE